MKGITDSNAVRIQENLFGFEIGVIFSKVGGEEPPHFPPDTYPVNENQVVNQTDMSAKQVHSSSHRLLIGNFYFPPFFCLNRQ